MFWDGYRWIDEHAAGDRAPKTARHARPRPGPIGLVLVLVVALMAAPQAGIARPGRAAASSTSTVARVVQENGGGVLLAGRWRHVANARYSGGHAVTARTRGATIRYTFTGRSVTVVGPKGRSGGRALVTVDGRRRLVVTERARTSVARAAVFRASWATDGLHTVTIRSLSGSFTVDAFRVTSIRRGKQGGGAVPVPTPTPTPIAAPTGSPDPNSLPSTSPDPNGTPSQAPTSGPTPTASPTPPATIAPPAATPAPSGPTAPVPASIDRTGSADASAALNAFVASVPDGTTIEFPAGAVYRMDQGIVLANRHGLVFDGNGATLRANGSATAASASLFRLNPGNDGIVIRGFSLVGNNPNTTTVYSPGQEDQMGVLVYGSSNVEIAHNAISHTWGDGVYLGPNAVSHAPAASVWVHDNTFDYTGRNGVSLVAASGVTVAGNRFDHGGYHVFDVEPDLAWESVASASFTDNAVGAYSLTTAYIGFFFASNGRGPVSDIGVTGNTVTGTGHAGFDGSPRGLNTYATATQSNLAVADNRSATAAHGPVLYFANVAGLSVQRNAQPLLSEPLARFTNCTGVVYP